DLYGGFLSRKLKEKYRDIELFSFAGPHCAQHCIQKIDLLAHSVSGIIEVLAHLGKIFKIFKQALRTIEEIKPDLIILIDFPDFNLKLAKTLNKKYPLFYYISPQVWAWRKNRIAQIKAYSEKMVVIFKFEQEFYKKEGLQVEYFGHPLLEIIPQKKEETKPIISLMPGSRKNEIKKHLPLMVDATKILEQELEGYRFRIIRPENIEKDFYAPLSQSIEVVDHSYQTLRESAFIITSSGTATVEIAILGIPFLILYKVNALTWNILRSMVKTEFIGMVNILAGRRVIEELLQDEATPQTIAAKTLMIMRDSKKYAQLKQELEKIKEVLSPYGATEKFADFIADYLDLRG
ncbi:MAG: lipid-A-disaccharide synthase, partial [Candidatus Omnitrophica bacterium]|nr:lipid-A-disaccharide synthase [Candidatus Omnitrophota bacterium]